MQVAQFGGNVLQPVWDTAKQDAVVLFGGAALAKGQVLEQVAGSGTAVNDVQTLTITGTPTGGSVALFWNGVFVATVPYNSTAAALKTQLEAFFGVGNVTTSGGPFPGSAIVVTFQGEAAGLWQQIFTAVNALTGGTTPAIGIVHTTAGNPAGGHYRAYTTGPAKRLLKYPTVVNHLGQTSFGDSGSSVEQVPNKGAPAYFQGHFKCADLVGMDADAVTDLGKLVHGATIADTTAILCVTGAG